ncbi:contact-dependent growth inhibition system immunity protein [Cytophaga aurantiaca]|uniref:contact-dependent growth inhibition system immunity protein n=1 Tax=Cytophaga aurantiaca TaxID=29530 RepID=UPI000373D84B|nr:contact-dependent growth inhibition system immunity protein [Cytophaga aurantiaca]
MIKLEHNWKTKTLSHLEKQKWNDSSFDSRLILRLNQLRDIPLNTFTTEDLRIMIGQQMSLPYLIPLSIETLSINLFAEGDLFEGDLLKNVLSIETKFWNNNKEYWLQMNDLIKHERDKIAKLKFDTSKFENSIFKNLK